MGLEKINLKMSGKAVIVLANFTWPTRFVEPTLELLAKSKNKVIVISISGENSIAREVKLVAESLNRKFIDLPAGSKRLPEYDIPHLYFFHEAGLLNNLRPGDIAVMENLNLLPSSESQAVINQGQVFVDDDFTAPKARISAIRHSLPEEQGLAFSKLKKSLDRFLSRSKKPTVLILGGARFTGLEKLIDRLMSRCDTILTGGVAANMFLQLRGFEIGRSLIDSKCDSKFVKKMLRDYTPKLKLPMDLIVTAGGMATATSREPNKIKRGERILDIGPKTTLLYSQYIKQARTLIWCGALGQIEIPSAKHATEALLRLAASRLARPDTVFAASGENVFGLLESNEYLDDLDLALPETRALLEALTA